MSLCPTPGHALDKSSLREIFDNPVYPVSVAVRKRAEFFLFFADVIYPMLEAYRVALNALYCDNNGRPAIDPVLLQGVLVLQFIERMPDRQAAEVGYKTQVVETVQEEPREAGEPTQNFITALVTQNASESDKPGMAMVLSEQANMGLGHPRSCMSMARTCAGLRSTKLKKTSVNCRARHQPHPIVARCSTWRPLI